MFAAKSPSRVVGTATGYDGTKIIARTDDGTLAGIQSNIAKLKELDRQQEQNHLTRKTAEANLAMHQANIAACDAAIAASNAKIAASNAKIAASKAKIGDAQTTLSGLSVEISQLKQQQQVTQQQQRDIQAQLQQLDDDDADDDAEIARLTAELGLSDDQLVALGQHNAQTSSKI